MNDLGIPVPVIQAVVRAKVRAADPLTWVELEREFDEPPFADLVALLPEAD